MHRISLLLSALMVSTTLALGQAQLPGNRARTIAICCGRLIDGKSDSPIARLADTIAVKGDPLSDITELERVRFVMKGGRVIKKPIELQVIE